ncbi:MAG TPA: alkaline phosphatase family protein [Nitrososphaerales archaeon]|nr:alkaline phosphatase family protein [Nitrososphaerales archaeon]
MPIRKLVIIGLDAADRQLTEGFMADGDMPRLRSIKDDRGFSALRSSIPPQTAPAWTSITTGVNPGSHGIYYFYNFSSSPLTITNATDSSTPRIWDYVGSLGGRSVMVNVPVTYPAREVRGAMVSGIPPWFLDERSVYPGSLLPRLREAGYEIDTPLGRGLESQPDLMVSRMMATEERRVELFLSLLRQDDWSFGMVVLTALDRLQHKAVGVGEKGAEAVRRAYREVDGLVGKVIDSLGGGVNFLVVSDHGYNERPLAFYPNAWLHEHGLLKRRSSVPNRLTRFAHDLFDGHLLWLPQALTKRYQGGTTTIHAIDAVDLEGSRAYVPGTDGVMVVKSKRDEAAIVSGLSELRDDQGKPFCKVYPRDQVYRGERLASAPALLIVLRDDINIRTDPYSRQVLSRSGTFPRGNHSQTGILLAAGPDVGRFGDLDLSLEDVAPTALALMRIKPPGTMEGRVVEEMLREPLQDGALAAPVAPAKGAGYAFSPEEEKTVMENLKRLGYA